MQDPIQAAGGEVAIVIYDAPLPPRYFRFSKKFIRSLVVIAPLLLGLLLAGLFLWGLGWRAYVSPRPSMPQVLTERDSKVLALESEIAALKQSNEGLTQKLSATAPAQGAGEGPYLLAVKRPYGMQDLTKEKRVSVDQFALEQGPNNVSFKFQILSSVPENKIVGHIVVFMVSASGLMSYPAQTNSVLAEGIKYSDGEPFSVSRLRPTNAEFLHRLSGEDVKFVIIIFSREGDLLLIQESPSYKVEAKS